jgi:pimeloyl-ACP methyl ester carboxylesterase
MPNVVANGIQIEYDTFGDHSSAPLILIMGLASQMIMWEEEFCEELAKKGLYVIRFDNRDIGLSAKLDDAGIPNVLKAMAAAERGEDVKAPYTIDDMADDTVGLLDALGIERAHICGASMGGMIAQTIAIRHPSRVLSIVSIMSSTGDPGLPQGRPEAMAVLLKPWPEEREANIEHGVNVWRTISGSGFAFDENRVREQAARSYDRCFYPPGPIRQLMAIVAHGSRKKALASITTPFLVIHGSDDPLVPVEAGRDTAQAVPGAELMIIEGMGHELPREAWPEIINAITEHIKKQGEDNK